MLWWALRVLIELAQYLSHLCSIFLDLAPILVNWSDIWEDGRGFGRIWEKLLLTAFYLFQTSSNLLNIGKGIKPDSFD